MRDNLRRFPPTRALIRARRQRIDRRNADRAGTTIMGRDSLHEFWRQPDPEGNEPERYFDALGRSKLLAELLADTPKEARILEVGCNVGRNLAHLHDHGWTDLAGVEINPRAVELLRDHYPQLDDTPIYVGAAEDVLPRLEPFDVVFTMAVLEHIHPDSAEVFDEIARLGKVVLAIEPREGRSTSRQFPHDLGREFGRRGFRLDSTVDLAGHPLVAGDDLGLSYAARRFERA